MPRPRKHHPPRNESQRVAAHRRKLMQEQHYRSVSFLASPGEFSLIEQTRERSGLTTKELMLFYLSGRYLSAPLPNLLPTDSADESEASDGEALGGEDLEADEAFRQRRLEARLEERRSRGDLFYGPDRQDFVLASLYFDFALLPGWFPFEIELIRDFGSYREALQYYLLRLDRLPPARQLLLLQRATADELGWEPEVNPWYRVRLRLNQIYPQIPAWPLAEPNLAAAYADMQAEYAEDDGYSP